ncbi:MAG TPA: hypothetical protein VIX18_04485 [Nitrospirota bacterium]
MSVILVSGRIIGCVLLLCFIGAGPTLAAPASPKPDERRVADKQFHTRQQELRKEIRALHLQMRTSKDPVLRDAVMRKRAELKALHEARRTDRTMKGGK